MGNTIGNPAAMKSGNTVTCHCAAASRQEALPGVWGGGVYLTAGAKVNNKMSHQAVCWDPRHDNHGDTVGGSVAGIMATLGESIGTGKDFSLLLFISNEWSLQYLIIIIIDGWMVHPCRTTNSHSC
jgi:hypothetical protein